MNYTSLLETTYQNMMSCDISEIEHYRNIADNLVYLKKENFIRFDMGNPIMDYVYEQALECNLTELEFQMVIPRYKFYIEKGFTREQAFESALLEITTK